MLEQLVNHYSDGNKSMFARLLGVKPQTINTWLNRGSFDGELIYSKCYKVNGDWLLSGEGDMLKSNESKDSVKIGDGSTAAVNVSGTIHGGQNVTTYPADQEIKNLRALLDEKERIIAEKDALLAEKERTIQILLNRK